MLDGSQQSLQAALNTLEIFGNMSGLRMNKDKTKMIWIGRKRFCREKLNISVDLNWEDTDFTLLGLKFSTNLSKLLQVNYDSVLCKIAQEVRKWKNRYLTPFGRITIIKANILPKCIHLFSSLPRSETFLKSRKTILFKFIWDGKPDKIKRTMIFRQNYEGGLNMIDVKNFEQALKLSWINRLLCCPQSQWYQLFKVSHTDPKNLFIYGDDFSKKTLKNVTNQFWKNVIEDWAHMCHSQKPISNSEILQNCIWYNSQVFKSPTFFLDWFKRGISLSGDITDTEGELLTFKHLKSKFNANLNIVNYYTVRQSVKMFMAQYKQPNQLWQLELPTYPLHLKVLLNKQKSCKKFYNALKSGSKEDNPLCERIWSKLLTEYPNTEQIEKWPLIYKICFKCIEDNGYVWFQYRILFQILGTRDYMKRTNIISDSTCNLCNGAVQDIVHLFDECPISSLLWEHLANWIDKKVGMKLTIDKTMKILGYQNQDLHFWPLNFVLLITRKYIFWCAIKQFPLDIYFLQKEIKNRFKEQEYLFKIKSMPEAFSKRWEIWSCLFDTIDN